MLRNRWLRPCGPHRGECSSYTVPPQGRSRMVVRIGLLGSGFVADFYLQGLRDVPNWEIPVVYSPNQEHARAFVERWRLGGVANSVDDVLRRGDVDLVLLAVPNDVHKELAIACARAGKNMVCTKPLARNAAEAKEMLEAAEAAGVMHGYAETEVFSPAVVKARAF